MTLIEGIVACVAILAIVGLMALAIWVSHVENMMDYDSRKDTKKRDASPWNYVSKTTRTKDVYQ